MTKRTLSSSQTKAFGAKLAKQILRARGGRGAKVVALIGDLGSGKTTFAQGFARGLGVKGRVVSPTFILIRRSKLHASRYKNLYHLDAYRLHKPRELLKLGLKEIFQDPQNIVLIEWADRLGRLLPRGVIRAQFEHGQKPNERLISF